MTITIQADTEHFNDAVRQFVKRIGGELPVVLRTQSRLLFKFIIDRTPPKTRAEGRARVEREILRAVQPIKASKFKPPIRALITGRKYEALGKILAGRVLPFTPDLHERVRVHGRVRRQQGISSPDTLEIKAHIQHKQWNVGRAKGGWVAAYRAVGGKPSEWIGRWARMGSVVDHLNSSTAPSIVAENRSEWASHGDDERIVSGAINARARAIVADIEKRLERAARATR